jgi:hypothetical protein
LSKHGSAILGKFDSLSKVNDPIIASEKQSLPIDKTERGMQMDLNERPRKHDSSICRNRDSASNIRINDSVVSSTELGFPQPVKRVSLCSPAFVPSKHDIPIEVTDRGTSIDVSEHRAKQDSSSLVNLESLSKVNYTIFEPMNHFLPMYSTARGMQIKSQEQLEKHDSSIVANLDSLSNANVPKEAFEKHNLLSILTERGMHIEAIKQPEKHNPSTFVNCDSSSNVTESIMAAALYDLSDPLMGAKARSAPSSARLKRDFPIDDTERGTQIDRTEQFEKQLSPIRVNSDPFSNVSVSIVEFSKHKVPIDTTERGIQTAPREQC